MHVWLVWLGWLLLLHFIYNNQPQRKGLALVLVQVSFQKLRRPRVYVISFRSYYSPILVKVVKHLIIIIIRRVLYAIVGFSQENNEREGSKINCRYIRTYLHGLHSLVSCLYHFANFDFHFFLLTNGVERVRIKEGRFVSVQELRWLMQPFAFLHIPKFNGIS